MDELGSRILEILKFYGISKSDFAQKLGITSSVLSHISSGRNKPGLEIVVEALKAYPEISADWLLLGKGSMQREKTDTYMADQLTKLIDEISVINDMNYNGLNSRLDTLKSRVKDLK